MRCGLSILIICFCFINCIARNNDEVLLHIPLTGKSITEFIPKGYDTVETATGDLNKDGISDLVMVLRDKREDTAQMGSEINDMDRLLIILFKTTDGWKLAGKSRHEILCKNCGGIYGDPFNGINIANGVLVIDHYGGSNWRWAYTHKFRFQNGDLYMIGVTKDSYSVFGGEGCDDVGSANRDFVDINFMTGQRVRLKTSENCKVLLNKKDKIPKKPLVKLVDYKFDN